MANTGQIELPAAMAAEGAPRERSWLSRLGRVARQKPLGTISVVILVAIWLACIFAPLVTHYGYDQLFVAPRLSAPSLAHPFGIDQSGRDVLSRVLYGGRVTLTLSFAATILGILLGTIIGVTSGYFLGTFDLVFQRLADAVQALPALVVLLVIGALFYGNRIIVLVAVAILFSPWGGRLFRSVVLKMRNEPFIEATRALGASDTRIVIRHILPNVLPLIIVLATVYIGANVLLLASLSFLGVINADYPDWGTMLNTSASQYMVQAPWLVIAPGAAITVVVLAYNMLGDALRDVLDPRLSGS